MFLKITMLLVYLNAVFLCCTCIAVGARQKDNRINGGSDAVKIERDNSFAMQRNRDGLNESTTSRRDGSTGRPQESRDKIVFKDPNEPDSAGSESAHSRGYPNYYSSGSGPEYGYVAYEGGVGYYGDKGSDDVFGHQGHHGHSYGHEPHSLDHGHYSGGHHDYHDYHDHHEHHDHGHHDHGLALKGFLLPLAGLALLGAAAAFVTNPVLLQLGVVSGKRRRRSTAGNMYNKPSSISDFLLGKNPIHATQNVLINDLSTETKSEANFENEENYAHKLAYRNNRK